MLIFQEAV